MTDARVSLESLPVECQRGILDRLHWRDLLSVSQCSRALRAVAFDEVSWRSRCLRRFSACELQRAESFASVDVHRGEDPDPVPDAHHWRTLFCRSVRRARDGVRAAAPLLAVPDNQRMHFRKFEEAQAHIARVSAACVREFIFEDPSSSTLLILAGLVECLARAPVADAAPEEILETLRDAGRDLGSRRIRLQVWYLGRLDGRALFRLRDDTHVYEGSLDHLARSETEMWRRLRDGIKNEVRHMEVESVGPRRRTFWSGWSAPSPDAAVEYSEVFAPSHF
jgi:hypothetical protein